MKMKSVVLAAATAVASSAFAQIFTNGDVYAEWFTSNATEYVAFDTPLDSPIAITNTLERAYDGYAVTAEVSIVVHAELPAVPSQLDGLYPKGAICAAVTNSPSISTNWYGLSGSAWVQLRIEEPVPVDNENYTLVMEFKDKGNVHMVCYSVVGRDSSGSSGWLDSGSGSSNVPTRVAFAGMGMHKDLTGLLVTEKVAPSASDVSWTEGYDFTNGTVSVTLGRYDSSSMGEVSLVVKDSTGAEVGSAAFVNETQSVTPTLTPGETYTYSLVQNAGGVVTTNDVGTFVAAAPGAGFSASAQSGISVVTNGTWSNVLGIESSAYAISGSEVFNIGNGALEADKLVIVDNKVTFTTWGDANDLQEFNDGTFAAITTVTNGAGDVSWKVFADGGWNDLGGGLADTSANTEYDVRAIFDFTSKKVAFSAKPASSSSYVPFTLGGNAWISLVGEPTALNEVGYNGIGKLTSVVGGNSDTNIAAVGTTSYATLADAIAAATNGSNTVTLRTNTQWPSTTPVGTYTVLTNGFSLVGLPSGEGINITSGDGSGFVIVVSGGSSHISGAGNIQIDSSAMERLGIDSAMTPAEIAAELMKPQSNGIEKWANYVLGINGDQEANKPYAAPVQNAEAGKLTFALGGVGTIAEGVVEGVKYEIETSSDGSAWTSALPEDGDKSPNQTVTVDAPADGVRYYRVKVKITLKD